MRMLELLLFGLHVINVAQPRAVHRQPELRSLTFVLYQATPPADQIQHLIDISAGGAVSLPPGTYQLGSTSLRMKSGVSLHCSDPLSTKLVYEGSDAAVLFDSVVFAGLFNCQIQIAAPLAARGIRFANTIADNKWNVVNNVMVANSTATVPTSGQIGLEMIASAKHAMYWNTVQSFHALNMDVGIQLTDSAGFSETAPNDNSFYGITVHHCNTGFAIKGNASENHIFGLSGSASGLLDKNVLLVIGDSSGSPANYNMIYGLVSDQGTNGQAWVINRGVSNTLISGTDQSGTAPVDHGTNTILERLGGGASSLKVTQLQGGAGVRHLREKLGCTTRGITGATCASPLLKWTTSFTDAIYTVSCSLTPTAGQPRVIGISQMSNGIVVTIIADKAVPATGNVSCIAIHD